ncbi:DLH domain-containing protein [Fusarium sp. LHS14.1]|nr:DLH domain-containing protein [Fusarium sp. LHS14.1]
MSSHPPAACCATGTLHQGTPVGTMVKIDGKIDGYLAKPSTQTRTAILYIPDIVGIWQNSKLMADAFAEQGYVCLVVDIFNSDPAPLNIDGFDIMGWLTKGSQGDNPHTQEAIDPIVISGINYLKSLGGITQIGAVGYCLGAKYVIRHFKDGISCGFIAHPSFVEEQELSAVVGPLSIAAAEHDDIFTVEKRHQSEAILSKSNNDWQMNLFSRVHHGFAVRGDMNDRKQRFAKDQAFNQAVEWFKSHLDHS